jgi:hypothetical protein
VTVYYKHNPVDWINDWICAYDPRRAEHGKSAVVPFLLWPRQEELVNWLFERMKREEDGLIEKSREEGASFLCSAIALHQWRYSPGFKAGFGSRKEALLDRKGDLDSLFEKLRSMIGMLPPELLPVGFDSQKHSHHMKLINPENGASIIGESGDNIGRGGRNKIYFLDESAFLEHPDLVDAAMSQNTRIRIDLSTPNGHGNSFYKRRFQILQPHQIFELDWRHDPRKDEEWYRRECERIGDPIIIARELDRDYDAGVEDIVCPGRWVRSAIKLELPLTGQIQAGLDVADDGGDSNALCIRRGNKIIHLEEWFEGDTTKTAQRALQICLDCGVTVLRYDSIGVGAGVRGEYARLKRLNRLPIKTVGINVGKSPTRGLYGGRPNDQIFLNRRAEMWWKLRRRFEHVYGATVEGNYSLNDEHAISIPENLELVSQLASPQYGFSNKGLIKIEDKAHMKKVRGIKSPNLADAVCLAFAPMVSIKI